MHTEKRAGLCKSVAVPVSPSLYRRKEFGSKRHFVMPTVLPGPLPCTICLTAFSQAQPLPQASSRTKAVRRVGGCSAPRWQMQCAALADAARCVGGCSAVRWQEYGKNQEAGPQPPLAGKASREQKRQQATGAKQGQSACSPTPREGGKRTPKSQKELKDLGKRRDYR